MRVYSKIIVNLRRVLLREECDNLDYYTLYLDTSNWHQLVNIYLKTRLFSSSYILPKFSKMFLLITIFFHDFQM